MTRDILLCVVGMTPQIVTETLYALAVVRKMPCPSEVHVVVTSEGERRTRLELLADPGRDLLGELCRQYKLPQPRFDDTTIHVIYRGGKPVPDLRNAEDNEAAADRIVSVVRELTADPDARVHFSIAGGRKTMTYYLGYCASLLGRPQDMMSHVLVNTPFEQSTDFYFPPKKPAYILDRSGVRHSTADAVIDLAFVPFLRLRGRLPAALLDEDRSFSTIVRVLNAIDRGELKLELSPPRKRGAAARPRVQAADGLEFDLPAMQFSLLWAFASIAKNEAEVSSANWRQLFKSHFIPVYVAVTGKSTRAEQAKLALPIKTEKAMRNSVDKLHEQLRERFGPGADVVYGIKVMRRAEDDYVYQFLPRPGSVQLLGGEFASPVPAGVRTSVFDVRS